MNTKSIASVIAGLLVIGTLIVLGYLAVGSLTARETGLLSTILTILSVLATWIVAHLYSETLHRSAIAEAKEAHQENLRTFALKAAEKVTNLSDQLSRLAGYLEEELQNADYETEQELVNSREQRIESTIHMIEMLKSMNDTSLSDWQGVIGEELEEQREEKEQREGQLIELVERLEDIIAASPASAQADAGQSEALAGQIELLRKEIARLIGGITGARPKLSVAKRTTRRDVVRDCPVCGSNVAYRQRSKPNSVKSVNCKKCGRSLISRYDKDGEDFYLELRESREERVECPSCKNDIPCVLDTFPGSTIAVDCPSCHLKVRVIRGRNNETRVKPLSSTRTPANQPVEITEELITQIRSKLPIQPWPKHIHKFIASDLGISNSTVQRAIRQLIDKGVFYEQIDGELFKLEKVEKTSVEIG